MVFECGVVGGSRCLFLLMVFWSLSAVDHANFSRAASQGLSLCPFFWNLERGHSYVKFWYNSTKETILRDIKKATSEKAELETSIPPLLTKATEEPADDSPGGLLHSSEKDKLVEFEKKWGGLFSAREVASDRLSIDKANAAVMLQQAEGAQWVEKYDKLRQALNKKIKAVDNLKEKNEDLNKQAKKFVK